MPFKIDLMIDWDVFRTYVYDGLEFTGMTEFNSKHMSCFYFLMKRSWTKNNIPTISTSAKVEIGIFS